MTRHIVILVALAASLWLTQTAHAQDMSEQTVAFFETADADARTDTIEVTEDERQAIELRYALDKALHLEDGSALEAILSGDTTRLSRLHPGLLELAQIFEDLTANSELDRDALNEILHDFDTQDDWYAGVYANTALSVLHIRRLELLLASQFAQTALDKIPEDVSPLVTDAQLLLSEQLTMLYSVSSDPERMLEASRTSHGMHQELGLEFNRHELMTNFLLAFNRRRDHDGAMAIADMLKREPKPDNILDGLSEVYLADLYNEVGDHAEALRLAMIAKSASDPLIQRRSSGEAMIAHAGLGQRDAALREMRVLGLWDENGATPRTSSSEAGLHALSLLASTSGDAQQAVSLMNRRLDLMIGKMYERSAADTSSFLSHLENNRERQVEREAALQREAELRAVQLEQKSRLNRMLWTLIGVLAVAFVLLLVFLRYRELNNRKVTALQQDALSAEKMKTEFLGVINHELRTPLNGIIGISDAMIHHASDPALKTQAQAVQDSGQLLHNLLDSLITMSTIEGHRLTLDAEPVDLSRTLSREVASWVDPARDKGLTFTHHIAPELEQSVLGDAKYIRQCAAFLLSNAVRFTHEGRIHLHATGAVKDETHMELTLIVADTGQGISDTVQARLFKPFLQADSTMTRKYGGAGLSLAIARKLARMMDGDLTVNSREGRGSEFVLTATLPLEHKAITPDTLTEARPTPAVIDYTDIEFGDEDAVKEDSAKPVTALDQALAAESEPEAIIDLMLSHPPFAAEDTSEAQPSEGVRPQRDTAA